MINNYYINIIFIVYNNKKFEKINNNNIRDIIIKKFIFNNRDIYAIYSNKLK